jgi:aminoglycoside 2'-N-acetyltransferase I
MSSDVTPDGTRLRRLPTDGLTVAELRAIRALMSVAFGADEEERFTDDDWEHALGGLHFVLDLDGEIITHAAVVERVIAVDGRPFRTGYVEAVATAPGREGLGFGSRVMTDATAYVRDTFEFGVLGTGRHTFYERLGWLRWLGPSGLRVADGVRLTPDDDGYIMVLPTPASSPLDVTAPITCDWRPGDVW